jgi:thioredoxin-related protein
MKVDEKDELLKKYNIAKLPSMAFFKDGKLIGKIEGIFEEKDKGKLKEKIGKIIP